VEAHQVASARLATQFRAGPHDAADRVRQLVAVQSQEWPLARWSVGQRQLATTDADVADLERTSRLVRTHVLRPTWHYVHPDDVRTLLHLTGPRVSVANASWFRRHSITDEITRQVEDVLTRLLSETSCATRTEILDAANGAGLDLDRSRLYHLLLHFEQHALICSGPPRGSEITYQLLDRVAPAPDRFADHDELVRELFLRYLDSHGPATLRDFAWWSSLKLADIRRAAASTTDELERISLGGLDLWHTPGVFDLTPPPAVLLLQTFDEFIVGFRESRHLLDLDEVANMVGREWGVEGHAVVAGAQVVGHWQSRTPRDTDAVHVRVSLVAPDKDPEGLPDAAADYARFLGRDLQLDVVRPP
jgi:uncharacterized protein YcaQ